MSFFKQIARGDRQRESDGEWSSTSRRKLPPKGNLGLHILHDCDESTIDIVAVHGLGANPDFAWVWLPKNNPPNSLGYPDKPFNWLQELLPGELNCRVMAFNYDSTWISRDSAPQQRLSNISDNLLEYLGNSRSKYLADNRPIIFIGHSFGGNIIEQAIVSSSRRDSLHLSISECTVGVIFLGTPHRGSPVATWGSIIASLAPPGVSTESRLLKDLEDQSDAQMDRLRDFTCWLFAESVPFVCAFEKLLTDYSSRLGFIGKRLPPKLVVPESSACIDGKHGIALDTDHFKINKFYGANDPSFRLIYPRILQMAHGANEALLRRRNPKKIPSSEVLTEGDLKRCLQQMRVRYPDYTLSDIERQKGKTIGHTCEWILNEANFCLWTTSSKGQFLRLVGSPGIGKTMMSTFLVWMLKTKVEKSQGMLFAYFFCDDKDGNRKTATALLRSLIWQLLLQKKELFEHMEPDFNKYPESSVFDNLFSDFSALWEIFQHMVQDPRAGEVLILIDALDECEESSRRDFLISITSHFQLPSGENEGKLKLLATCRPDVDNIEFELADIDVSLRIDAAHINKDLSEYIHGKVDELARKKNYTPQIRAKVSDALRRQSGGTFLWVSLMVAELSKVRMLDVDAILERLPKGLDGIYEAILDRIGPADQIYAQFILRCMVATRRPLKVTEIQTAFAVWKTNSMQSGEELSVYNDITSICSSILYVSSGHDPTINFCHQSVKDFLLREPSLSKKWYHTSEDEANFCIFRVCWTYLSAEIIDHDNLCLNRQDRWLVQLHAAIRKKGATDHSNLCSRYLFLDYSYHEWDNHAIASSTLSLREWQRLAIDLAAAPTLRDAWLLRAAGEGQEGIVQRLLDDGADMEADDRLSQTPLFCAARNGREAMVRLLLKRGANIEAKNYCGQTALWRAVSDGHAKTVSLLLDEGATIEAKDNNGRTPLIEAARNKHEAIVRLLRKKGADIEAKDDLGLTPLFWAAIDEHMADVSPIRAKIWARAWNNHTMQRPPLSNGHIATISLLLDEGANIEATDILGQGPLTYAAASGHKAVVRLLVKRGAQVNAKDLFGQTPLFCAVTGGYEAIVRLLIKAGADIDLKTPLGHSVLQEAFELRRTAVFRLLVDNGAMLSANDFGQTLPSEDALDHVAVECRTFHPRLLRAAGTDVTLKAIPRNALSCAEPRKHVVRKQ